MLKDLTGKQFNRLTAQWPAGRGDHRRTYWLCLCSCGTLRVIRADSLLNGHAQSCGCLHEERALAAHTIHNHTRKAWKSPTYRSWQNMHDRCNHRWRKCWKDYGGRGITVCERWKDFRNFLADMGERPDGMTLDRYPNQDGNYEPDNCRWATRKEQQRNLRMTPARRAAIAGLIQAGIPTRLRRRR